MKNLIPIILLIGTLLVGCASPRITCSTFDTVPVEPGQPIDRKNFSVVAPEDGRWCIRQEAGPSRVTEVVLGTHPLQGEFIEKPERGMLDNVIVMQVTQIKHGGARLQGPDELQDFVAEWIKRGYWVNVSGSELIVAAASELDSTLVRSSVRPWRFLDADCVRYEFSMEDFPKPNVIITAYGVVCHHPTARDYLIVMEISERYERGGKQIDPNLLDVLKAQYGEPFFKSLEFKQAD